MECLFSITSNEHNYVRFQARIEGSSFDWENQYILIKFC